MPPRTGTARKWAALGALPVACAALCILLLCGAFATTKPAPWAILVAAVAAAVARWGLSTKRRAWHAIENGFLCALAVLAIIQLAPPLQPLMYLLAAGYVLLLPLRLAIPLLAVLITLDASLAGQWPQTVAHASFTALFAALYHLLLGGPLRAARRPPRRWRAAAHLLRRPLSGRRLLWRALAGARRRPHWRARRRSQCSVLGGRAAGPRSARGRGHPRGRGRKAARRRPARKGREGPLLPRSRGPEQDHHAAAGRAGRHRAGKADVRGARPLRHHGAGGPRPSRRRSRWRHCFRAARAHLPGQCRPGQQRGQARSAASRTRARRDGSGDDLRCGDGRARPVRAEDLSPQVRRERGGDAGLRLARSGRAPGAGPEGAGDAGAPGRRSARSDAPLRASGAPRDHRWAHGVAQPAHVQRAASRPSS